jgi:hypothetical protein
VFREEEVTVASVMMVSHFCAVASGIFQTVLFFEQMQNFEQKPSGVTTAGWFNAVKIKRGSPTKNKIKNSQLCFRVVGRHDEAKAAFFHFIFLCIHQSHASPIRLLRNKFINNVFRARFVIKTDLHQNNGNATKVQRVSKEGSITTPHLIFFRCHALSSNIRATSTRSWHGSQSRQHWGTALHFSRSITKTGTREA